MSDYRRRLLLKYSSGDQSAKDLYEHLKPLRARRRRGWAVQQVSPNLYRDRTFERLASKPNFENNLRGATSSNSSPSQASPAHANKWPKVPFDQGHLH